MFAIVSSKAILAPWQKERSCTATRTYALCERYWSSRAAPSRQQRRQQCVRQRRGSGLPSPSLCAWCRVRVRVRVRVRARVRVRVRARVRVRVRVRVSPP